MRYSAGRIPWLSWSIAACLGLVMWFGRSLRFRPGLRLMGFASFAAFLAGLGAELPGRCHVVPILVGAASTRSGPNVGNSLGPGWFMISVLWTVTVVM